MASFAAKLLGEFVGTFLLVFTVGCNVLGGNAVWGGISIACVLMVSIYAMGKVSGANFNPAVSLALGMIEALGSEGLPWNSVMAYGLTQLGAGIIAGICYVSLWWDTFNLAPAFGFGPLQVALCEMLYTFMLCFVVLNVAAAKDRPNQFYGLAIGFVIVAGAYGAGAVSGGCFNPAVAIAIDTASVGLGFGWCIFYVLFECIGAILAAYCFMYVRPKQFGRDDISEQTSRLLSEFLGTFMLVLTVGLNVLAKSPAGAFSIAASLMCMIYALGDVSGAHFNPAVTIAIAAAGHCRDVLTGQCIMLYCASQIIGGVLGGFVFALIHHGSTFALGPVGSFRWAQVAFAEMVFTFVLCFVVICAAVHSKTNTKDMFGLAIGSCVTVGGFAIGAVSGGSLNPAVSFGIGSAHLMNGGNMNAAACYTAFEIAGGVAAAMVSKVTHPAIEKET